MSAIGTAPISTVAPKGMRARRTLLSSCAVASALVVMGHPLRVVAADGYNARVDTANTFGYTLPNGSNSANQATINLDSATSIITWTPNNEANTVGSIQFQDAGGVTTFIGPARAQDYTVLNRVIPTDQTRNITFGGTTRSFLNNGDNGPGAAGGNIWFYSPGGIVVAPGARFDVGSLLLSTNPIGYTESGYGTLNPNQIQFGSDPTEIAVQGGSSITISSTAQLNALGRGANYVALVAPRIVQSGTVSATQAAYVAAEVGDMTIDAQSGLFSFAITNGSTVPDALTHNGTTQLSAGVAGSTPTPSSATGTPLSQRAYLVAVPKNDAITMLVGGTIRYAAAAAVDNGVVVLSSGNIADGLNPQTVNSNPGAIVGGTTNIVIGNGGSFGSIRAAASGNVTNAGGFTVTGDVNLFSSDGIELAASGAGAANAITINRLTGGGGGNLSLASWVQDADGSRTGNVASLSASGGAAVTIGGGLTIDTSGVAQQILTPSFAPFAIGPAGPSGTGGTASLSVTDSQMTIDGAVTLNANGVGLSTNMNGGVGTGGTASLTTTNGAISIGAGASGTGTGGLIVSANGTGGEGSQGGDGIGNVASITANGLLGGQVNAIRVAGVTTVTANGTGGIGYGYNDTLDVPGIGTGGTASITLNPNTPDPGPTPGPTPPPTTQATFSGGGSVTISASGTGGAGGSSGYTVAGSNGTGGTALLALTGGAFGATALTVDAGGTGGAGANTSDSATPGAGGTGFGGSAGVSGNGGTLDVGALTIGASASGGAGGRSLAPGESGYGVVDAADGGDASGGRAVLIGANGFAARPTGVVTIGASGTGAAGGTSLTGNGGDGGDGAAGSEATEVTTGLLPGPNGAYVSLEGGSSLSGSELLVSATGTGGGSLLADAGAGAGGTARVRVARSSLNTGSLTIAASAGGGRSDGNSENSHDGGAATGGAASLTIAPGSVGPAGSVTVAGATVVDASATGGLADDTGGNYSFANPSVGGAGTGGGAGSSTGGAFVDVQTGTATFAALTINAGGTGGASLAGGDGGTGTGGAAGLSVGTLTVPGGGLSATSISIGAAGIGGGHIAGPANETSTGYGGRGGAGIGGRALMSLYGGTITATQAVTLGGGGSGGTGGQGSPFGDLTVGDGGTGIGGTAEALISGGQLSAASLSASANGAGGRGGEAFFATSGEGGAGLGGGAVDGTGSQLTGGTGASVSVSGATGAIRLTGNLEISASGTGANGRAGSFSDDPGSNGGLGRGGSASLAAASSADVSASNIVVRADALGGDSGGNGAVGGDAVAGTATIGIVNSSLATTDVTTDDALPSVSLSARADGGAEGGSGTGGTAQLSVTGTGTYRDDMVIDVSATGGDGADGSSPEFGFGTDGGAGGNATAGTVDLDLAAATIDGLSILASASAGAGGNAIESGYGTGNGGAGGNATAGTVTVGLASGSIDGLTILASATGGSGGTIVETGYGSGGGGTGGVGGNAGGGPISITASGTGTIGFGEVSEGFSIDASRTAGAGGRGGNGEDGLPSGEGGPATNGAAGGTGGAGGSATGALVSLTASNGGTISLTDGGSFQVNLNATAGSGGGGGAGGDGGDGGSPETGGSAGIGGNGGDGGSATGGSFALDANGGTITGGDLSISTSATGARGGAAGNAGLDSDPSLAGAGGNGTAGNVSIRTGDIAGTGTTKFGRFTAGNVTINASGNPGSADDSESIGEGTSGRVELLGRGSYLSGDEVPTGSIALSSLDVSAFGEPPTGVGDPPNPRDPSQASIDLLASNGRVSIAGDANLNTRYQASLRSESGGTIAVGGALNVSAGAYITATQAGSGANAITANSVDFTAFYGEVIAETPIVATASGDLPGTISMTAASIDARNLTATDSISLTGTTRVDIGNLTTTAPVNTDATSLEEAGGGTIDVVAGEEFLTRLLPDIDLLDSTINVTGVVSASNRVTLTSGGDINVRGESGARVESGNLARLDAGDDVFVSAGAAVRAGLTPLADPADTGPQDLGTPAGLIITAGLQPVDNPQPGNPHTIVVAGTLSSGVRVNGAISADTSLRRGILLSGDAVQAEGGIAGRSLTVSITNPPALGAARAGNVDNLSNGCLVGDVCLGALDLTNLLTVGALTGDDGLPTTVRIAGGASTQRTSIRSQGDVRLGAVGSSTTFDGRALLRVESLLGQVNLPGNTVLSGGAVVQVLGATGISGAGATIQGDGAVGLYTGSGGLTLASLIAGTLQPITPNPEGEPTTQAGGLSINGPVTIGTLLSVENGNADVTATGNLSVANVEVGDGYSVILRSTGGAATVGNAAPAEIGTATDILVSSETGAATLTSGTARRDIRVTAATAASAGTIRAGDDIALSGTTVSLGSATTTGTFAETGYGSTADGSNISLSASGAISVSGTADARGDLRLTSTEGAVTANVLAAGDDVIVSGTRLAITSATTRGLLPEAGYGASADGSNILLTAAGADTGGTPAIRIDSASAAVNPQATTGDLTVRATNAAGSIVGGTLAAGRNIALSAGGNVQLASATANGPAVPGGGTDPVPSSGFVSIVAGNAGDGGYGPANINITGTVDARGLIRATAGGDISVGSAARLLSDNRVTLTAGDDIRIASGAVVQAARSPLPSTSYVGPGGQPIAVSPAELILNAGGAAINYAPATDNVASLIIDGTISANARPITLTGGAIQADAGALTGGTLTINVPNAPAAGAPQSNDGGQLRAGCLQGDVCLGAVTLTGFTAGQVSVPGALRIGTGDTSAPTNVRIAGAVDVASIGIVAKNSVTLGTSGTTAIAQTAAGGIAINAAAGPVNLLGNLTLTGGTDAQPVTITGATGVNGPGARIVSRGRLDVSAPNGSVTLAGVSAPTILNVSAGRTVQIGQVTGGAVTLTGNGVDVAPSTGLPNGVAAVNVGSVDATNSLAINVPQGGIRFATLGAPTIALTAGTFIAGGDATARQGGFSATAPGSIGVGTVTAEDGINIDSGASVTATALLSAVGSADTDSDSITVSADGAIDVGTARADAGDVNATAGGTLNLGAGTAANSISLSSVGGGVTAGSLVAGTSQPSGSGGSGGDIRINAAGDVRLARGEAREAIRLVSGSAITSDILRAGTDIALAAQGAVLVRDDIAAGGAITASGTAIDLNALGDLNIDTLDATAGNLSLASRNGAIRLARGTATGDITLRTGDGVSTTGTKSVTAAVLAADGDVSIAADGPVSTGSISAGRGIVVNASGAINGDTSVARTGIALTAGGNIRATTLRAGQTITASTAADITITSAQAVDTIDLRSTGGAITTSDLLATNSITARALGNLFVRDAVATSQAGNVLLAGGFPAGTGTTTPYSLDGSTSVTGTVSAGRSVILNGGGRVTLAAGGRVRSNGTIAIASGDDIISDAGSVIGLGHVTVAAPTGQSGTLIGGPADSVTLAAGALRAGTANRTANGASAIAMNGSVDGVLIGLTSEAVDVGAGGRVGSASTTQATFTNVAGRTIVGGNGDASVYSVSNAALGRVRAQRIGIVAPADVTVQAVTLNGSAATDGNLIGNAAEFRVTGGGVVSVEGAVALNSAAQTDLFAITAPTRIAVVTPSGSIALNAAGGAPGGRLALTAPQIIVGTAQAAAALAGLNTVDLRDARLGTNDGALSEAGFLQANSLEFDLGGNSSATRALYIQNSGAALSSQLRRGFTAGSGGVSILTGTGTAAEIIINGRQSSASGFVSGRDLIPALKITGTAQASMASFDPRSTANGCLIAGVSCRFDIPSGGGTPPIQDTINQIVRGQDTLTGAISSVVQQLNSPLVEMIDFTPFRLAGIIDEPVTGAGNDDFYAALAGEDAFGTGVTVDQQVTGSGNDALVNRPLADGRCDPNQRGTDPDCR